MRLWIFLENFSPCKLKMSSSYRAFHNFTFDRFFLVLVKYFFLYHISKVGLFLWKSLQNIKVMFIPHTPKPAFSRPFKKKIVKCFLKTPNFDYIYENHSKINTLNWQADASELVLADALKVWLLFKWPKRCLIWTN